MVQKKSIPINKKQLIPIIMGIEVVDDPKQ